MLGESLALSKVLRMRSTTFAFSEPRVRCFSTYYPRGKKCYLKSVMRCENMHPGGYEGSVTGAVYLEDDDNGTQLEDTRGKILLEIREPFPCTTVVNARRGITGVLADPDWEVAGSTYGTAVTGYIKLLESSQPIWRHGRFVVFLEAVCSLLHLKRCWDPKGGTFPVQSDGSLPHDLGEECKELATRHRYVGRREPLERTVRRSGKLNGD